MQGARVGSEVRLRMEHWDGDWPQPGDYLVTEAGSGYLVDDIRPARPGSVSTVFTAVCIKVTADQARRATAAEGARLFWMRWAKRRKRNRYSDSVAPEG